MSISAFEHITRIRSEKYGLDEHGNVNGINPLATDLRDSIDHLAQGLYTRNAHFIFELIQNAEDNVYDNEIGDPTLTFKLLRDDPTKTPGSDGVLIIENNEVGFSQKNIDAICAVGKSTKNKQDGFIGEKGIGFKSIFRITSVPFLFSNGYQISLPEKHNKTDLGFIVPEWIKNIPDIIDTSLTSIVLPLNKPDFGYDSIKKMLWKIEPETIIFLSKLIEIKVITDNNESFFIFKNKNDDKNIWLQSNKRGIPENTNFILFKKYFAKPEFINHEKRNGITGREVSIAFPVGVNEKHFGKLFAYLPVRFDTGFPFIINADFILPSSREDIQDIPWNRNWLMPCVGELVSSSLPKLKDNNHLSVKFLQSLSKSFLSINTDDIYYPIAKAVKKIFSIFDLLPTDDGSFVSAKNAKLARGADLRKLLSQAQLGQLFQSQSTLRWLAGEITQALTPDLRDYLINELDVEEVTSDVLARRISHSFLSGQPNEWFVDFYGYLSGQEALWRAPRWERDPGGILRSKPILRLANGSQEIPFKPNSTTPNAFLPPPFETTFPVVRRSIVADERAQTFLKRLGLSEPDVFDDIVEMVLSKYNKIGRDSVPDSEHQADIQKIVCAMGSESEAGKRKVIQAARRTSFLKATNPTGDTVFKKPAEIYLNTAELRRYFSSVQEVWFLHDEYTSSDIDIDVWHDLGVSRLPRKLPTPEGLPYGEKEYSTRAETIENFDLDGLEQFLEAIQEITDFEEQRSSASVLWGFLRDYLELDERFFKARYQWFYYSSQSKYFSSMILVRLKNSKWVPTKDGSLEKPGEITTDQLLDEFLGATELTESLGIVEGADQSEDERKRERATELGISLEDIEFLNNHRDEIEQLKAALAARKERPTFPTRPVANPERRQERLAEQLTDAPPITYEMKMQSIRTSSVPDVEVKTYLREQYVNKEADQMVCQICKEEMPFRKRDKTHYFEKKEALSSKYLSREHEAQYLALCPLCAAKYDEFIKSDDNVMAKVREAIILAEEFEIPITLGEERTSIRFVETHYHDLKTIIDGVK